jgi:hypothetical protein
MTRVALSFVLDYLCDSSRGPLSTQHLLSECEVILSPPHRSDIYSPLSLLLLQAHAREIDTSRSKRSINLDMGQDAGSSKRSEDTRSCGAAA